MKNLLLATTAVSSLTVAIHAGGFGGSAPEGSEARAVELIKALHLSVLPRESGYLD
jgi:hypothetical protein